MAITLPQLRYFLAVSETGNISHAANRLHIAQSAISHHISVLEEELGVPLLVRKHRGVEVTAAGQRLVDHARAILRALDIARDDLRSQGGRLIGQITVAIPYSPIRAIGVELLQRMHDAHPDAVVILSEGLSVYTYERVIAGTADIALTFNPPPDDLTTRIPLLQEELVCVGTPELLGSRTEPLDFDDLAELPLALLHLGDLSRAILNQPGQLNRFRNAVRFQLASVAATLGVAEAGLACVLVPRTLVREQLDSGQLMARPLQNPTPSRTLVLVSRQDIAANRLRETVAETIASVTRDAVNTGLWPAAELLI
ncbi:MAG: LysR family transcriptional regulator [Thiothrix sp.]|nr:LysR family transcriptional regulator [Thiothrix sp.]HPE59737.1 LysR family transcriptional regulator [Thiolinea sp.]